MRRMLSCVLLGIMTAAPRLGAQDQSAALANLSQLNRSGELSQLVQTANSLLSTATLAPTERGTVLTYLGHAYQQGGEFTQATSCYEKALAVFDRDGGHPSEYAITLAALATLYAEIGQIDTAKHVLLRSVRLFEKEGNHAKIAMIWNDLATLASDQHSRRESHKWMAHAIAESQLAAEISQDELAALTTTQARIAELDGDARTAIADFQHSLSLWKQSHDDRHPETGWLYVLLGGAYLQAGDLTNARATTHRGLSLLEVSSGPQSPRFFSAELAYSKVLDAAGDRDEAATFRAEALAGLHTSPGRQQAQSEISISALR